jgi:hypothetical protein
VLHVGRDSVQLLSQDGADPSESRDQVALSGSWEGAHGDASADVVETWRSRGYERVDDGLEVEGSVHVRVPRESSGRT